MRQQITKMLERYEAGQVSRRQLIGALAALCAGAQSAEGSTFQGAGINHIALRVTDIPRARSFYQELLGLPMIRESGSSCFLGVGREFLALFRNQEAGLDHYCIAIENFEPDKVMDQLTKKGLKPRRPQGTDRIYFHDPDGLEVQLSAVGHGA